MHHGLGLWPIAKNVDDSISQSQLHLCKFFYVFHNLCLAKAIFGGGETHGVWIKYLKFKEEVLTYLWAYFSVGNIVFVSVFRFLSLLASC